MWMLHCDMVSKYVSDSMDRKLSLGQKIGVRMHLFMCSHCARVAKQLQLIRRMSRTEETSCPQHQLDDSVKKEIKEQLRKTRQQ
jgi:predicted anti-sigma-YlaC factor YlaD